MKRKTRRKDRVRWSDRVGIGRKGKDEHENFIEEQDKNQDRTPAEAVPRADGLCLSPERVTGEGRTEQGAAPECARGSEVGQELHRSGGCVWCEKVGSSSGELIKARKLQAAVGIARRSTSWAGRALISSRCSLPSFSCTATTTFLYILTTQPAGTLEAREIWCLRSEGRHRGRQGD